MPVSLELHHHLSLSSDREPSPLVHQFDIYLRIVEDAYLGFFRERSASHTSNSSLLPTHTYYYSQEKDRGDLVS